MKKNYWLGVNRCRDDGVCGSTTNITTGSTESMLLRGLDIAFLSVMGLIAVIVVLQVAAVVTL